MKKLLTAFTVIIIMLSCKAQQPDICTYTEYSFINMRDSLVNIINIQHDSIVTINNYWDSVFANVPTSEEQLLDSINEIYAYYDSILSNPIELPDTLILLTDTFRISIISPGDTFNIRKEGLIREVKIIDGLKRMRTTYVPNDFDYWVQDDIFTRASGHVDLR